MLTIIYLLDYPLSYSMISPFGVYGEVIVGVIVEALVSVVFWCVDMLYSVGEWWSINIVTQVHWTEMFQNSQWQHLYPFLPGEQNIV